MSQPTPQSVAKQLFRGLAQRQAGEELRGWVERRRSGASDSQMESPAEESQSGEVDLDELEAALAEG